MKIDSIFCISFGVFTLILAALNKGGLFFLALTTTERFDERHKRVINIIGGLLFLAIGILLAHK